MLNSKNILWFVLISIIIYFLVTLKETYLEVNTANSQFYESNNPKRILFQDGRRLDPSSQEYKNRIAQIDADDKTRFSKTDMAEDYYKNFHVELSGTIDKDMAYRIETRYIATADKKSCKTYDGGMFSAHALLPSSENFEYRPRIEGTQHHIRIPLGVFNPHEKCKFQLENVTMYISLREKKKHGRMVYLFHRDALKEDLNNYRFKAWLGRGTKKIDMECISPANSFSQESYFPCGLKPLTKGYAIVENLPKFSMKYEINIAKSSLSMIELDEAFNKLGYGHRNKGSIRNSISR